VILASVACAQTITPEELASYWRSQQAPVPALVDPYNYLAPSTQQTMYQKMAQNFPGIDVYFFVFRQCDGRYRDSSGRIDINRFTDDLIRNMLSEQKRVDRSLFIVYAIEDRLFTLRTGSDARKVLTDTMTTNAAQAILPDIKQGNYQAAFPRLLDLLSANLRPSGSGILPIIIIVSIVLMCLCCFCCLKMCCGNASPNGDYSRAPEATPFSQQTQGNQQFSLPCGHMFERSRYDEIMRRGTCPFCQAPVGPSSNPNFTPTPFSGQTGNPNFAPTPFSGATGNPNITPTPFSGQTNAPSGSTPFSAPGNGLMDKFKDNLPTIMNQAKNIPGYMSGKNSGSDKSNDYKPKGGQGGTSGGWGDKDSNDRPSGTTGGW